MSISVGTPIGPYEIVGSLGAGGMGEVYRGRDDRLGRDVAIKVLPPGLSSDPDRLARFQREARLLASLNHPHIAAIYGVEESDGMRALVLELVEGATLAERCLRPMPLHEALDIARQIAEALDAAHERGIVHRDLKPANVMIASAGNVKVLDFGLAKAAAPDPGSDVSTTAVQDATCEGTVLGTPGYMSPEQARGLPVDKRTDIWAFGCVLFEMLAGERAFTGNTTSDRIAAILEHEPPWDRLPAATPAQVRHLLQRCLDKDPKRRLRDIGEARLELEKSPAAAISAEPVQERPRVMTRRTAIGAVGGTVLGAAAMGGFSLSRWREAVPRSLTRFAIPMPEGQFHQIGFNDRVAMAPDGRSIVFNTVGEGGTINLHVRDLRELESRRIEEVTSGVSAFFAPDGRSLGLFVVKPTVTLRTVRLSGGVPATVCSARSYAGGTWAEGDTIFFVPEVPGGLSAVPAAGGQPRQAVKIDSARGERALKFPSALPGGNDVLLTVATAAAESFDDAQIVAVSIRTGERKVLVERGTHARYSSGHLVYARDGKLYAVAFDPGRLEVDGKSFPVLEGVLMSRNTGVANFDLSATGDLAYIPGGVEGGSRTLVWVDRDGNAEKVPLPSRSYLHPRISPDGRRLALEIEGSNHDVHLYDFATGVMSNLTNDGQSHRPVWSADGTRIGYRAGVMGLFRLWQVPADRSQPPREIAAAGTSRSAESYSPDGGALAYTSSEPGSPSQITVVALEGDHAPRPLDKATYAQGSPKFSPDGRWLAYCSMEAGKPQVFVQAYPGPGAKIQVSSDGGTDPVWKRGGGELFYRSGDAMMSVPVSIGTTAAAGRPRQLWSGHYSHGMSTSCGAPGATSSNYDVTADGQRFLMIKDEDQDFARPREIVVALGWVEELRRLSRV